MHSEPTLRAAVSRRRYSPRGSRRASPWWAIIGLVFVVLATPGLAQNYSDTFLEENSATDAPPQPTPSTAPASTTPAASSAHGASAASVATPAYGYDQATLANWRAINTRELSVRLVSLWETLPYFGVEMRQALTRAVAPGNEWHIGLNILLIFLVALFIEYFTIRNLLARLNAYVKTQQKTTAVKFKFIFSRICLQLIGLAVLGVVAYLGGQFFLGTNMYLQALFAYSLGALLQFRLMLIILRNIFTPNRSRLRPIPLDDAAAKQMFFWFAIFFAFIEFSEATVNYFQHAEVDDILVRGLAIPYSIVLQLIIFSQLWRMRAKITTMFVGSIRRTEQSFARLCLTKSWPYFFTAWLLLLWLLWLYHTFLGQVTQAEQITMSWLMTLAFPIADRMFHGLISNVAHISWLQSPRFPARSARFVRVVQSGFRFILLGLAAYLLADAWGFNADTLITKTSVASTLSNALNIVILVIIGYIIWEWLHAFIERKLPEEPTNVMASLEGDGGGEGASRAETLIPLMRTVLTIILTIFFTLTILHSLGVSVGPLLAGAGVVGIAIGFGAQKLVQDVISGIFFLIDDAFRRGEYIEMQNLRGTVEKISLRSMQLRHHLGAVQTIPYGEIKTVKNLSRDWITMKLELRLPYDADIEKVRKIIKTVGQEMLKHEVMGPSFILPLKSQGVMRVEESALIVRMKFTSKPGEQWVIRREAYHNVRDALSASGIHFAHREVRVLVPELGAHTAPASKDKPAGATTQSADDNQTKTTQTAAAAATSSILASEAIRHSKLDDDDMDMGGDDR